MEELVAHMVELPGRVMPRASAIMHMLFAVVMEVQAPQMPQEFSMSPLYYIHVHLAGLRRADLVLRMDMQDFLAAEGTQRHVAAGHHDGGDVQTRAPIRWPGTTESQEESSTMPSKKLPSTVSST